MSLFGRKCAWCGEDVGNPSRVERMGKRFCSEDHARDYLQQTGGRGTSADGGCC